MGPGSEANNLAMDIMLQSSLTQCTVPLGIFLVN